MTRRRHGRSELDRPTSRWLFAGSTVLEIVGGKGARARTCPRAKHSCKEARLSCFLTQRLRIRPPPQSLHRGHSYKYPVYTAACILLFTVPDEFHSGTATGTPLAPKHARLLEVRETPSRAPAHLGKLSTYNTQSGIRGARQGFSRGGQAWPRPSNADSSSGYRVGR